MDSPASPATKGQESELRVRAAATADLPHIVRMLADDALGASRERVESPLPLGYQVALDAIEQDPNSVVVVAELEGVVVGTLQLTFIPNLSYQGSWRAAIEAVRVDRAARGRRIGHRLMEWAIEQARTRGCRLVQLTSNRQRADAVRFYESLGFVHSHAGLKLDLGRET